MSRLCQATFEIVGYNVDMSEEDKKYLQSARKMRPSLEVFQNMVSILTKMQKRTDQLLNISSVKT